MLQRLQGGIYKQALRFTVERTGHEYTGENAFALVRQEADVVNGVEGHLSGLSLFMRWLETEYGLHEQDSIGMALDKCFDFQRGPRDLAQYIADFDLLFEEAGSERRESLLPGELEFSDQDDFGLEGPDVIKVAPPSDFVKDLDLVGSKFDFVDQMEKFMNTFQ